MAKIRQEINFLNAKISGTQAFNYSNLGLVTPANYTGINDNKTYILEFLARNPTANAITLTNTFVDCVIPANITSYQLFRTGVNIISGTTFSMTTTSSFPDVKAARCIIYQSGNPITATETQIEIGAYQASIGATTATPLTNPKYFYYDSSKWDSIMSAYGEVSYLTSSTKGLATIRLQNDTGNFLGWTDAAIIVDDGGATALTRVRSSGISLISGRNYRVTVETSSTKGLIDIFGAKLIIGQGHGWVKEGAGLPVSAVSAPSITSLTPTGIAFIDNSTDSLRKYSFNGSSWNLEGTGLLIGSIDAACITSLNSTGIAFIDNGTDSLRKYSFNGVDWSLEGTSLVIGTLISASITALNSTGIAFVDNNNDSLRKYSFNGSSWNLEGTGLLIGVVGDASLATLNPTGIAFVDVSSGLLRKYSFNGTTWNFEGNGLSITVTKPYIVGLTSTGIALIDSNNDSLRRYDFDGINWNQKEDSLSITVVEPAIAALNSTGIVLLNEFDDLLQKYTFTTNNVTKLQAQYLLANTTGVATGVQSFYTIFDPDEWGGVTNTYIHEGNATGITNLNCDLVRTGITPTQVTNSTITSLIQREQSSSMTMPITSGVLDVRITSNN